MAYTFTTESCYALADHTVSIENDVISIVLDSTETEVFRRAFGNGLALNCSGNNLCVGSLTMDKSFARTIDLSAPGHSQVIDEDNNANRYIGNDYGEDSGIYTYNLNQCPIRLSADHDIVTIECPCDRETGPCTNGCFSEE